MGVGSHRHRLQRVLEIDVVSLHGTDPAAAFLHQLTEKREVDDTEFLGCITNRCRKCPMNPRQGTGSDGRRMELKVIRKR